MFQLLFIKILALLLIVQAHIDHVAFSQEGDHELSSLHRVHEVVIFSRMAIIIPEVGLDLGHHCRHGCEEGSQDVLVAIPSVNRFSGLCEYQVMTSDFVELFHRLGDVNILD